jgi:hypothetical protein
MGNRLGFDKNQSDDLCRDSAQGLPSRLMILETLGEPFLIGFKKSRPSNTAKIVDGSGALRRRLKNPQCDMRLDASFIIRKVCARFLMNRPEERSGFSI